jgi:uncharacterized protein (DUF1330 family)
MSAYAMAHMRQVTMGPPIVEYLQRIDATLQPFGGRFIVHGGEYEVMEGTWPGTIIIIEFPGRAQAHAWYKSDAYQEILALRTDNSRSDVIVVDGVGPRSPGHRCPGRVRGGRPTTRSVSSARAGLRSRDCRNA